MKCSISNTTLVSENSEILVQVLVLSILFLLIYIIKKIVLEKKLVNIVKQLSIMEVTFIV